jgi:hypothetical protein
MCTITFIPRSDQDFILTSNRDEAPGRNTFPPRVYEEEGVELLYPKDAVAGGTWIGASERKRVVCLMNGGFVAHKRKEFYGKSRGVVVKDFLKTEDLKLLLKDYDFSEIEPFTAIIIEWEKKLNLFSVVWDGEKLHESEEPLLPQIWSSSPLYPNDLKSKRETWFSEFLDSNPDTSANDMLSFHKTAGDGDLNSDLIIDRGFVRTKSITQIVKDKDGIKMRYEDLETGEIERVEVRGGR